MTLANEIVPEPGDGRSAHEQQLHREGADAAVDALSWQAGLHRANGDLTRLRETEAWLALAREDQAAAAASIDYRDLAAMGPESVMTEASPCCGYPGADREAGQ